MPTARRKSRTKSTGESVRPRQFEVPDVADLSCAEIEQLSRPDSIAAIRVARLPQLDEESARHLEFLDRRTLRQVLFLARECCRHRVKTSCDEFAEPIERESDVLSRRAR